MGVYSVKNIIFRHMEPDNSSLPAESKSRTIGVVYLLNILRRSEVSLNLDLWLRVLYLC